MDAGRRGGDLHPAADAARDAADALGRRRPLRLVVPRGLRRLLPDRRRRLPRRGRLPLRHGPHRRRPQRRRAPALDRVDRGGAARVIPTSPSAPSSGSPTSSRARSRAGSSSSRRAWTSDADGERIRAELVQRVRDEVGAVAALRQVDIVAALPKTRSGKILRKTMREIADGHRPGDAADHRGRLGPGTPDAGPAGLLTASGRARRPPRLRDDRGGRRARLGLWRTSASSGPAASCSSAGSRSTSRRPPSCWW